MIAYHISSVRNRSSIAKRGLLPREPRKSKHHGHLEVCREQPRGIYLFTDDEREHRRQTAPSSLFYRGNPPDIWEVDVPDGVPHHKDPVVFRAILYPRRISPKRLTRIT